MTELLFRQEVIDASRGRLMGTVVAATPPGSKLYISLIAGVIVIITILLTVGQFASRAEVRGVVSNSGGVAIVSSPDAATVREVHVVEGQTVERGEQLVTISLSNGSNSGSEGLAGQLSELDRQDTEMGRQITLARALGQTEMLALGRRQQGLSASIRSMQRQLNLANSQIALARQNAARAARLAERGAGTQQQVEEARSQLLGIELDQEAIQERVIIQTEALEAIDSEIQVRTIGAEQSRSELVERRAALAQQREDLLRRDQLTLTAPRGGRIADISATEGMRAQPNDTLVSVIPQNSGLEVTLYAPSSAVGFVRPGQEVRLQFDAFPYQRHGTAMGLVTRVSDVPAQPVGLSASEQSSVPMFRVRVAIDPDDFRNARGPLPLRTGMTLTAHLVLENRSLWQVLFDPILRAMRA